MRPRHCCLTFAALLVLVAFCAPAARAQAGPDTSMAAPHASLPVAAWASLGLGEGSGNTNGVGGVWSANVSIGLALLTFRQSDIGPFIGAGDGVRDNALLVGVRSPHRRLFASGAIGYAEASHYHQCDTCGRTDVDPSVGMFAYDVRLHANYVVPGIAVAFSGTLGPSRVAYSAFTVGVELGWFGQ